MRAILGSTEPLLGSRPCISRCSRAMRTKRGSGGRKETFLNIWRCKRRDRSCTPTSLRLTVRSAGKGSFQLRTTSEKRSDVLESSLSLLFRAFFSGKSRLSRTLRPAPSIGMVVGSCCGGGTQDERGELSVGVSVRESLTEN